MNPLQVARLLAKPNATNNIYQWYRELHDQMFLTGRGYVWVLKDSAGQVTGLHLLPTNIVMGCPSPTREYPQGHYQVVHPTTITDGTKIDARCVLVLTPDDGFPHLALKKLLLAWEDPRQECELAKIRDEESPAYPCGICGACVTNWKKEHRE